MNDNTKILLGFVSGLLAGVVTGVLLAPEKGDDTRKMIVDKARSLGNEMGDQLNPSIEKLKNALDTMSEYATKAVKKEEENNKA